MQPQLTANQQKVYDALSTSTKPLTIREIESQIDLAYISIRSALTSLQKKGIAKKDDSVPRDQPWSLVETVSPTSIVSPPESKPKPKAKKVTKPKQLKSTKSSPALKASKQAAELKAAKEVKELEAKKDVQEEVKEAITGAEEQLHKTKQKFQNLLEKVILEVQKQGNLSKKQVKNIQGKLKKNPLYKKDKKTVEKVIKNIQKKNIGKDEIKKLKKIKKDVLK